MIGESRPGTAPHRHESWNYWRPSDSHIVELGTVRGLDVALPVHFHEEDQVTFVLSGRRRFVIDGQLFAVAPGQGMHIPARTPHHSLSEPSEIVCINLYTPAGAYAARDLISDLARQWRRVGQIGWPELTTIAEDHRCVAGNIPDPAGTLAGTDLRETVEQAAQRAGMSREGFSRRFRKHHGMPPHAFWLLEKLNDARRLLRRGEPIAGVAAETGFADQSHLGRCFRRVFGVTPGRYRAG
ncbi:AraC family transcriptional regulator [Azospirillum agricola]|uniref:AraC family transcriptional regulator n=1 Tax=Azospirillum agricola TaxID=1720247 RepID=UPI000A0EFEBB|nr:helix-turn-helix domain-containing protein [Azospirillum agricola]SMH63001.1 Cupin domain-containing protein [Azospirillum lipoferum]